MNINYLLKKSKSVFICIALLFVSSIKVNAQCSFIGAEGSPIETITFCIDNSNTVLTTKSLTAGQYVAVNVVMGFNYTFSYPDAFATQRITVFNSLDTSVSLASNSSTVAVSVNWKATFSGVVYVLISRGNCNNSGNANNGKITIDLNSIGNTEDSQTTFGTDKWVGHVYNHTDGPPPGGSTSPSSPSTTTSPFIAANYVGYYNVATETINEDFGGNSACFPVLSNGVARTNIYTELFSVRYKMKSTRAAGCYLLNVNGDDGVRVYVDNVLVFNQWKQQGNTSYCNNLIYLNGNSDIVLDYYEHEGGNVVGFSLSPFDGSSNVITSAADVKVCSGVSTLIDAAAFGSCTGGANGGTNTIYQWQVSTDNITFTDISGAITEDYTPVAATTTTSNIIRYYRRSLKAFASNASSCVFYSNTVKVTTSASRPNQPGSVTGTAKACKTSTYTYSIAPVANATSYAWSTNATTGWTITPATDGLSVSIAFSASATSGNLEVRASNGCGTSNSATYFNIQVGNLPTSATISGTATTCTGIYTFVTFNNPQSYGVNVFYNINGGVSQSIYVNGSSSSNLTVPNNLVGAYTYNLVNVTDGNGFPNCSTAITGSATVTFSSTGSPSFTNAPGSSSCSGTDVTYTTQSGMTNYVWNVPGVLGTDYSITSGGISSTDSTVTLKWLTTGSKIVKVNYTSACGGTTAASNTTTVGLAPNNVSSGFTANAICSGGTPQLTFDAENTSFTSPYVIKYKNNSSATVYTVTIPTAGPYSFTIGDNPTSDATYTLLSIANATCTRTTGFGSSGASLIVRPVPTASISGATTVCQGASSPNVTFTNPQAAAITVTYNINGGTSLTENVAASNSISIAAPTNISGTYTYKLISVVYQSAPSCVSTITGKSAVITVNNFTAPTIGTITPSSCTSGGSVVLNSLPSGAWTLTQNDGATNTSISGSGSSYAVTGLAVGNYTFKVSNGTCTSLSSSNVNISSSIISTTWNGSGWSNGAPNSNTNIIFDETFSSSGDLSGCSCQVNIGKNVVFNSGHTLKVTNQVTILGTGNLTFENSASLVQENGGAINSGNITYKRETNTIVRNTDYTYWSTPVSPLKLAGTGGISYNPSNLAGSIFYSYLVNATSEGWKSESATTTMKVGEGYIIRGPLAISANPPSSLQATFVGVPNNGDVSITINKKDASYLLGNPYPSAIDADTFLGINSAVLNGTLYFWTHNTAIQNRINIALTAGTGAYAYTSDDYASYNLTGGVGIEKGVKASSDLDSAPIIPTGKIGAGQGFIASTYKATGSIVFNNSMRVSGTSGNNAQFFKVSSVKGKATATIEKNRIWLDLYNEQGAFKQTLLGYVNGATNDIDSAYDGETTDGQEFIDFYSVNQDKNLVIQGRALPFNEADEVPLGYRTAIDGNFTISIEQTEGVFTSQSVFLEDKLTNTIADLNSGNYTFNTAIGTFNDRFVLRYTNKTLGLGDIDPIEKGIYVSSKNKQIKINSTIEAINNIQIYDLSGKLIYQKTKIDSNELVISNLMSAHQVLLVKVSLLDGSVVTKKLIY